MKTRALVSFCAALGACTPVVEPTDAAGPAVCDEGPRDPSARIEREVAVTGSALNSMRRDGDEIFVVESGDNTVSRFDVQTGRYDPLVDVGNERGPWDLFVTADELWITNYIASSVTVADRASGEVIDEIVGEELDGPAGVAVLDDVVYVGNTEYHGEEYGPGSIAVLDRASHEVLGVVAAQRQNPQSLDVVGDRVVVVDSGAFGYAGSFVAGSEAAVEIWTPTADPLAPDVVTVVMPLVDDRAVGIPGRPAHRAGSSVIYLPSATAPVVFSLDVVKGTWLRGPDDPIQLYETDGDALNHAAMGDDGVLWVTAYNEDALFLVDTRCDAVLDRIELESSSMLAGPHGVVPVGDDGYVALELANELVGVHLDFGETK